MRKQIKGIPTNTPTERNGVSFLPLSRKYCDRDTGDSNLRLIELVSQRSKATLNTSYCGNPEQIQRGETLFKEITSAPPEIPLSILELMDKGGRETSIPAIADALETTIMAYWNPDMFHLVPHSSGYDSRIISQTIINLRKKHGDSWLGGVLFFCRFPETGRFKDIMQLQGWGKGQYAVQQTDRLDESLDFGQCWKWTNDYVFPPMTEPYPTFIRGLVSSGAIPVPLNKVQLIAGGLGNEVFMYTPRSLIDLYYYGRSYITEAHAAYGEIIQPFASSEVLRCIRPEGTKRVINRKVTAKVSKLASGLRVTNLALKVASWVSKLASPLGVTSGPAMGEYSNKSRRELVGFLSPELLQIAKAPNEGPEEERMRLSPQLKERCLCSFKASWYCREVKRDYTPPDMLWDSIGWREYGVAAMCEELRRRGTEVNMSTTVS